MNLTYPCTYFTFETQMWLAQLQHWIISKIKLNNAGGTWRKCILQVAQRDMKSDNILLSYDNDGQSLIGGYGRGTVDGSRIDSEAVHIDWMNRSLAWNWISDSLQEIAQPYITLGISQRCFNSTLNVFETQMWIEQNCCVITVSPQHFRRDSPAGDLRFRVRTRQRILHRRLPTRGCECVSQGEVGMDGLR